jgi:hypothetical protein
MKHALSYAAANIGLAIGLLAATAVAQTTANGPYYATPSWDQTLPSSTRFIVLSNMSSEAVLDRETGLVWERTPTGTGGDTNFDSFQVRCLNSKKGGRMGWRMASIDELTSLLDAGTTDLPAGHPFNVSISGFFNWVSATRTFDGRVYGITRSAPGSPILFFRASPTSVTTDLLCVRGSTPGGITY